MPEYLSPAVYAEEVDTGTKPIEGVTTSTAGMVGVTERGPINVPIPITSIGEYHRWFGDLLNDADFRNANGYHCYLPHAVEGFFTNGGNLVYVTRILRDDAAASTTTLYDRGTATSVSSRLLRAAAMESGTASQSAADFSHYAEYVGAEQVDSDRRRQPARISDDCGRSGRLDTRRVVFPARSIARRRSEHC